MYKLSSHEFSFFPFFVLLGINKHMDVSDDVFWPVTLNVLFILVGTG